MLHEDRVVFAMLLSRYVSLNTLFILLFLIFFLQDLPKGIEARQFFRGGVPAFA